jgi:hypothetical protein
MNGDFDYALGRGVQWYINVKSASPSTSGFKFILLKTNEAEATLITRATLAAILAAPGNVEANMTNYTRHTAQAAALAAIPTPNLTNHVMDMTLPNQFWNDTGAVVDHVLSKMIIVYCPDIGGIDATFIPFKHLDLAYTTTVPGVAWYANASGLGRWRGVHSTI